VTHRSRAQHGDNFNVCRQSVFPDNGSNFVIRLARRCPQFRAAVNSVELNLQETGDLKQAENNNTFLKSGGAREFSLLMYPAQTTHPTAHLLYFYSFRLFQYLRQNNC
jgi:hypothetical protein